MAIIVAHFADPTGTAAEPLWFEGMQHFQAAGLMPPGPILPPGGRTLAWLASVNGMPACASFRRLDGADAVSVMTYCRPAYRGLRLYAAIRPPMEAALLAMGATHIRSAVMDDPLALRSLPSILRHGGEAVGEELTEGPAGPVRLTHYRRPLRAG